MSQMPNFVPPPAAPQWGGPPYQQPPQNPWPPAPQPAPPTPPRRNTGLLVGLLVTVIVLLLALVAWLVFFRPSPNSPTTTASSSEAPQPGPPPSLQPSSFGPMAWSGPVSLGSASSIQLLNVNDSGVDGIVIAWWSNADWTWTAAAVDTKTMKVLWTKQDMYFMYADKAGVVMNAPSESWNSVQLVDPRTGNDKWDGTGVVATGAGYIVTLEGSPDNPDTICARKTTNPDTCFWTAPRNTNEESTDLTYYVFGGGAWLLTRSSVLDMATGRPAPFGADVNDGLTTGGTWVEYVGPTKDRIVRLNADFQADPAKWQIQRWDVASDKAIGQTFITTNTGGDSGGVGWTLDAESPNYLLSDNTGVTAYSWKTGQQQWQAAVPNGAGCAGIHGNIAVVGPYCGISEEAGGIIPGVTAFDMATGNKIWSDPSLAQLWNGGFGNIGQVLYLMDEQNLYAYDNTNYTKLGSVALPAGTNHVDVAAGTVFAASGGQLYMLQV